MATLQSISMYDMERARHFGNLRTEHHRRLGTPHADKFANQNFKVTGADQDYLSCLSESQVVRYLELNPRNCGWFPFSTDKNNYYAPDILGIIEVRRVTAEHNPFVAGPKDVAANAIVVKVFIPFEAENGRLVSHEPVAHLLGWQYARTIWHKGQPHYGDSRRFFRGYEMETLAEAAGIREGLAA